MSIPRYKKICATILYRALLFFRFLSLFFVILTLVRATVIYRTLYKSVRELLYLHQEKWCYQKKLLPPQYPKLFSVPNTLQLKKMKRHLSDSENELNEDYEECSRLVQYF